MVQEHTSAGTETHRPPAASFGLAAACLLLIAGAAPACRTLPAVEDTATWPEMIEVQERLAAKEPLPFTVAVAFPVLASADQAEVADTGDADAEGADAGDAGVEAADADPLAEAAEDEAVLERVRRMAVDDRATATQALDAEALQARLTERLEALGAFRRIVPLDFVEPTDDADDPLDLVLAAADEVRADLVLIPRLRRHDVSFVEPTGWWVPSWISGFLFWFPTFWFPDERWAGTVELEAELVYLRTGRTVWGPRRFAARTEAELNDFDRGWDVFGPWGIPLLTHSRLGVEDRNFRAAGRHVMPPSMARVEGEAALALGQFVDRVPIRPEGDLPQTLGIAIGVEGPAYGGVEPLVCAGNDAAAIAAYLTDPQGGEVDQRNLILLRNEEATLAALGEVLDVRVRTLADRDRLFVYFAGYGATDPEGAGYLVLHDTDPNDLAGTALRLDRLMELFDLPQHVTMVLDTSFAGRGGRTLPPGPGRAAMRLLDRQALEGPAIRQRGRFLLTAADVRQVAQEYPPEGHGIFTLVLLEALSEADLDGDGRIVMTEVKSWLRERVPAASGVIGHRQQPLLLTRVESDGDRRVLRDRTRAEVALDDDAPDAEPPAADEG